jgi:hypothetical protein
MKFSYSYITYFDHIHPSFTLSCHLSLSHWSSSSQLVVSMYFHVLFFFLKLYVTILGIFLVFFWDNVSLCCPVWPGGHYISQAGLELTVFLSWPPEGWDYMYHHSWLRVIWFDHWTKSYHLRLSPENFVKHSSKSVRVLL